MLKARKDRIAAAVASIIGVSAVLSLGDATVKGISPGIGLWQLVLLRAVMLLLGLVAIAVLSGGLTLLRPYRFGWLALRSSLLVAMWVVYYASLPHLSLAVAAAGYYTLPFFILILATLFGGERLSKRAVASSIVGFLGTLLVLRPGAEAFTPAALLPILAALLYAAAMLVTRTRCREEHPLALSMGLAVGFILAGSLAFAFGSLVLPSGFAGTGFLDPAWRPIDAHDLLTIGILAAILLLASVGTAFAYQNAPGGVVAPCDFAYVGFAVVWGFLLFGEVPELQTILGLALIVGAGITSVRARTA